MSDFVTLQTYTWAHEAAIAKGLLESEEIPCFLNHENGMRLYPNGGGAEPVKLQVKSEWVERALEVLEANGYPVVTRKPYLSEKLNAFLKKLFDREG